LSSGTHGITFTVKSTEVGTMYVQDSLPRRIFTKICYLVEETFDSLNDSPEKVFILAARFLSLRDDDRNSKVSSPSGYLSDSKPFK
jgi:hypothetical protein